MDNEQWWADTPDGEPALVTRVGALTEWQRGRDSMREERDAAQTEVVALQSTIAQLQARVAELESGRGEPVAWRCFDGEGNYDFTEDPETAETWRKLNGEQYSHWLTPLDATAALNNKGK